jgi:hypothetical protein
MVEMVALPSERTERVRDMGMFREHRSYWSSGLAKHNVNEGSVT